MQPDARRDTLKRLLRETTVRRQADLVRLLRREGFDCTQSSISRDLRELGVAKFGDHYVIANESSAAVPANDAFAALAGWVRDVLTAGPSLTVIKTNRQRPTRGRGYRQCELARSGRHDFWRRHSLRRHRRRR